MFKGKVLIRIIVNSILGVVLIAVWLKFVNLSEISQTLKRVETSYILWFFVFYTLSTTLRSLRLKKLLAKYPVSLKNLIFLNFLSQFLSFMIPVRAGEITKSVYLGAHLDIPFAKAVVWVLLDRFLDLWLNLTLVSLLILTATYDLPIGLRSGVLFALIGFSLAAIVMIYGDNLSKKIAALISNLVVFPRLKRWFMSATAAVIGGFEILRRSPKDLVILILLTVGALVSDGLIWYFSLKAVGVNLGFLKSLFGSLISALTFLIPAAPGYVGSAQISGLAVFGGILGVEANLASAAAILTHILAVVATLITGVISLNILKFDLQLVWKQIKRT